MRRLIMKKENYKVPESIFVNGEKVNFRYNREERLSKIRNRKETNDCFLCKKNFPYFITFINIVFVCVLALFFSKYVGRADTLNDNGIQYFISKKYFTKDIEFNFQIKNVSKVKKEINYTKKLFEIIDDNDKTIYYKEINVSKVDYRPNETYLETIIIDKPKFGNYKAIVYADVNKSVKIELKFNIR